MRRLPLLAAAIALLGARSALADPPAPPSSASPPPNYAQPIMRPTPLPLAAALGAATTDPPPAPPPAAKPATPPAAAPRAAPAPKARPRPKKAEPPPLPAPELRLTIEAPTPDGPWTMREENTGSLPLHVLADARLLSFDVTPPDAPADADPPKHARRPPRPIHCALPADMRPTDADRSLVIPPGRAYVEKLDPRLFCFGARQAAALVAGAHVTPRLEGSRELAVVEPIEGLEPKVATEREWAGDTVTIGPLPAPVVAKDASAPVTITTPAFADVVHGWEAEVPITATHASGPSLAFLMRPETVVFDVTGPSGVGVTDPSPTVHCAWPGPPPSPIAETYTHLSSRQQATITVLLSALCPDDTLRHPGLYVVRAKLDTRRASGSSIGVHTFEGEVLATGTTRVRVREWSGRPAAAPRPQLAP